jgi:hypothetical protein
MLDKLSKSKMLLISGRIILSSEEGELPPKITSISLSSAIALTVEDSALLKVSRVSSFT